MGAQEETLLQMTMAAWSKYTVEIRQERLYNNLIKTKQDLAEKQLSEVEEARKKEAQRVQDLEDLATAKAKAMRLRAFGTGDKHAKAVETTLLEMVILGW